MISEKTRPLMGRVIAPVRQALLNLDPTALLSVTGTQHVPDFTLIGVYRRRNADHVLRLVEQAPASRLWGLDGVHPSLSEFTVGEGPGWRFPLLNRLAEGVTSRFLVVSDDDVHVSRGSLPELVSIAEAFQLDLCQPAHDPYSFCNWGITRVRPLSTLRLTTFVEIGPLLVVGPRFRKQIVPFPDDDTMGWGAELEWFALHQEHGARLAIVDAVNVKHLGAMATAYDASEDRLRLATRMHERGLTDWMEVQRTLRTVRPWRAAHARPATE